MQHTNWTSNTLKDYINSITEKTCLHNSLYNALYRLYAHRLFSPSYLCIYGPNCKDCYNINMLLIHCLENEIDSVRKVIDHELIKYPQILQLKYIFLSIDWDIYFQVLHYDRLPQDDFIKILFKNKQ